MTVFDQRGQQVTYQYNAAGDINFGAVKNKLDLIAQMKGLQEEVCRAIEAEIFDEEVATEVEYRVKKAVQQAQKDSPDKKTIVDYLNEAKDLIAGVTAAVGLVTALNQAIEAVQTFF
jgi:hypothetical protein